MRAVCGAGGRGGGSSPAGTPQAGAVWPLQDQGKPELLLQISPDQGRPTQDDLFLDYLMPISWAFESALSPLPISPQVVSGLVPGTVTAPRQDAHVQ